MAADWPLFLRTCRELELHELEVDKFSLSGRTEGVARNVSYWCDLEI